MMPLPRCLPSSPFICLPSWSPFWAAVGCRCCLVSLQMSPFMISILLYSWLPLPPCLPSFVSLHSLSFASQCRFLCPPPPASPFIAFHLSPSFFRNAIWGLCRCNGNDEFLILAGNGFDMQEKLENNKKQLKLLKNFTNTKTEWSLF